jgi:hypothetical protein
MKKYKGISSSIEAECVSAAYLYLARYDTLVDTDIFM